MSKPVILKLTAALALVTLIGCSEAPPIEPAAVADLGSSESDEPQEATANDIAKPTEQADVAGDEPMQEKVKVLTDYNALTDFEKYVILEKGTEGRFVGEYTDLDDTGTYVCRQCNAALYKSDHKFHSGCGWPAFDDEIAGAVDRHPDADGYRVEIVCHNCGGHLGHVFEGEALTDKNIRHCVNSVSMTFVPAGKDLPPMIVKSMDE